MDYKKQELEKVEKEIKEIEEVLLYKKEELNELMDKMYSLRDRKLEIELSII